MTGENEGNEGMAARQQQQALALPMNHDLAIVPAGVSHPMQQSQILTQSSGPSYKFLLMPGDVVGEKRKMVFIPSVQSFEDLCMKIKNKLPQAASAPSVILEMQVADPPPGQEAHLVDEVWAEVEDLELFDPGAVTSLRIRAQEIARPLMLSPPIQYKQQEHATINFSMLPTVERGPETPIEVALREDLERRAIIYSKGKNGVLTGHMRLMNEAAKQIALRDPKLVEKGNRADLMRDAANLVRDHYQFKHGYSRSKHAEPRERPLVRKRMNQSKKWNAEMRAERRAEVRREMMQLEEQLQHKESQRQMAVEMRDQQKEMLLVHEAKELQSQLSRLQYEQTDLIRRERRSAQRFAKLAHDPGDGSHSSQGMEMVASSNPQAMAHIFASQLSPQLNGMLPHSMPLHNLGVHLMSTHGMSMGSQGVSVLADSQPQEGQDVKADYEVEVAMLPQHEQEGPSHLAHGAMHMGGVSDVSLAEQDRMVLPMQHGTHDDSQQMTPDDVAQAQMHHLHQQQQQAEHHHHHQHEHEQQDVDVHMLDHADSDANLPPHAQQQLLMPYPHMPQQHQLVLQQRHREQDHHQDQHHEQQVQEQQEQHPHPEDMVQHTATSSTAVKEEASLSGITIEQASNSQEIPHTIDTEEQQEKEGEASALHWQQ